MFRNPLEERGGRVCNARNTFFKKKVLSAHYAQQRGQIKVGPQVGGNATSPLHSRGSPKKGGQNQNWMPNPCLLGGPQVGGNATSLLHSRGSPKKGGQNQNWMPNPCLLGGPQVG